MREKVYHVRRAIVDGEKKYIVGSRPPKGTYKEFELLRNGGGTIVILDINGQRTAGIAVCSDADQYSRYFGRRIASGRARKAVGKTDVFYYPQTDSGSEDELLEIAYSLIEM